MGIFSERLVSSIISEYLGGYSFYNVDNSDYLLILIPDNYALINKTWYSIRLRNIKTYPYNSSTKEFYNMNGIHNTLVFNLSTNQDEYHYIRMRQYIDHNVVNIIGRDPCKCDTCELLDKIKTNEDLRIKANNKDHVLIVSTAFKRGIFESSYLYRHPKCLRGIISDREYNKFVNTKNVVDFCCSPIFLIPAVMFTSLIIVIIILGITRCIKDC